MREQQKRQRGRPRLAQPSGARDYAIADIDPRDLEAVEQIQAAVADVKYRQALIREIRGRRLELNALVKRCERSEARLRKLAMGDAVVELVTNGARVGEAAKTLGVTPAFVTQTISAARSRYAKLLGTGEGLSASAKGWIRATSQRAAIGRGEDPFAGLFAGTRGKSLLTRLDETDPHTDVPEVVENGPIAENAFTGIDPETGFDLDSIKEFESDEIDDF